MGRRYPSYKNSGAEWLGQIPSHWGCGRLKFSATSQASNVDKHTKDGELPVLLCNYVDVYKRDFITGDTAFMSATATEAEIAKFTLKKGDILITKDSESWDDIAVPALVTEPLDGVLCGYHLSIIRAHPDTFHPGYLFRLLCSDIMNYQFKVAANGVTRFGLPGAAVDNALLVRPPVEEQTRISDFLDRETARIDALIEKKRRLLELLEEKRLAVITHTVTKGLDPSAPMKDSGIAWLAEIPKHWQVKRLKFISPFQSVGVVVNPSSYWDDVGEIPFLYGNNVREYEIDATTSRKISKEANASLHKSRLDAGDLVVVRVGAPGVAAVVPKVLDGANCASMMFVRRGEFDSSWLCHLFNSRVGRFQVELVQYGAAQKQFNIDHAVDFAFPCPPRDEQTAIANHLDELQSAIALARSSLARSIELLEEERAVLITSAVTGKIDVRGAVEKEAAA